jgi:hypothetical protein
MDYSIGYKVDETGRSKPHSISMTGKIEAGDYEKLLSLIRTNIYAATGIFSVTIIQSNGGDLGEAIKIGKLLKSLRARVFAERCVSACFFIYVMAPTHYIKSNSNDNGDSRSLLSNVLGIHRPYFDREEFSKLTIKQAEKKYEELESSARDILVSAKVSQDLIDKMFSVPSSNVYFLSPEEVQRIGMFNPTFEELIIAKCGNDATDKDAITDWWKCIRKIEHRDVVEGLNTVMKNEKNPGWERFYKKVVRDPQFLYN